MKYAITGILTTTSPLNVAEAGSHYVNLSGRFIAKQPKESFPCIKTRHARIARNAFPTEDLLPSSSASLLPDEDPLAGDTQPAATESRTFLVPFIPGNSLRGRLRREAAREIYDALLARGDRLSINAYNVLQCGAVTGNPDGDPATLEEFNAAAEHPYFGLLGGGPRMLRSTLRVDDVMAVTPDTLPFVPFASERYIVPGRLTEVVFKRRNDDIIMFSNMDYQKQILGDHDVEVNAYQDKHQSRKKGEDTDRGLSSFTAVEHVMRGVHLALRCEFGGGDAHLGLFLASLTRLALAQRLGGFGQIGYGRFCVPELMLRLDDDSDPVPVFDPESAAGANAEFRLSDHPVIANAIAAWNDYKTTSLSAEEIERFCTPKAKDKDKE